MERNTRQRGAIRRAFQRTDRPLGTSEVLELARSEVGGLGIATVYRNIRALVDEGWLATVELPGAVPRYEISGKDHHHHFQCRQCDRVFEMAGCVNSLADLIPPGFALGDHYLVLYGRCAECAARTPHDELDARRALRGGPGPDLPRPAPADRQPGHPPARRTGSGR